MTKIHVVAAIARDVKGRVHAAMSALHHESQKRDLYAGLSRVYRPKEDGGDDLPPESTLPQLDAQDVLAEARALWTQAWDVEATLVRSNSDAYGDLIVDGVTLVTGIPATFFLYLEKQLADLHTFFTKLPVLDPTQEWHWDDARGVYATDPIESTRSKKVPRGLVLYEATKEHPAQVQPYSEDVIEGYWSTTKLSGALPVDRKRELLARVTRLRDAVKQSRERANQAEVVDLKVADALLEYVLRRERD